MDKKDFFKRLYAGIFFVIGMVLICVVVLAIGMEKGFTQPKFQLDVVFHEVAGLTVGAPIRLSGVTIGTVGRIDFLEQKVLGRGVVVTLNLFKRYRKQLEHADQFAIKTEGILGEKLIDISVGEEKSPLLDMTQPIIGEDPLDVQDLAKSFGDAAVSLQETAGAIDEILSEMEDSFKDFKRLINRVEQRLLEGNLFKIF